MKKVCMVAYTHYLSDPRVRREAEALAERKDKVDCICLKRKGQNKSAFIDGVRLYRISVPRYKGSNIFFYMLSYISFFIFSSLKLIFLFLKERYDIIQVHNLPDFMVFTSFLPKLLGAKVILDMHDLMPELYLSKFKLDYNHPVIKIITWVANVSMSFANHVITVSEIWRERLISRGLPASRCTVVMNLPDTRIFKERQFRIRNGNNFRLIHHGSMSKRQDLDIVIKAVAKVRTHIPNIEFEIIGEGEELSNIIALVKSENLENCIYIKGNFVPVEQLPQIICQADVGIVTYKVDKFIDEAISTKLFEYVILGVPVISVRTKSAEAYFDDSSVSFFASADLEGLVNCIIGLYRYPRKRQELAINAQKVLLTHSWQNYKNAYYKLIDDLVLA
ncbi:MAG: glycosyltransferase family 4 protein [Candidatus Omnitrophica bacterium]|nr:glycosyltransferase family 4 protein [Candidatus Omnitrophota bacterium]